MGIYDTVVFEGDIELPKFSGDIDQGKFQTKSLDPAMETYVISKNLRLWKSETDVSVRELEERPQVKEYLEENPDKTVEDAEEELGVELLFGVLDSTETEYKLVDYSGTMVVSGSHDGYYYRWLFQVKNGIIISSELKQKSSRS